MARITIGLQVAALALATTLVGCASRPIAPPLAAAPAPPPTSARPQPPAGASASQTIPPIGPDGRYVTLNSGIGPAATIWHVRSALNVAALGCRGPQEAVLVANYNAMLASKKTLLKAAFAQTEAATKKTGGADWRDAHDRAMTQTYNFFAQPPAKERFCAIAAEVAAEAATVDPTRFGAFAGPALARLEAPFTDFYRDYDAYRRDLAAWDAGDRTATAFASAPGSVRVAIAAPAPLALTYAPMESVIAWTPAGAGNRRLASAEISRRRP